MDDPRITIISADRQRLEDLQSMLRAAGSKHITADACALHEASDLASRLQGGILIADCDGDRAEELAPLRVLAEMQPAAGVIIACHRQAPEFLIQAMRLGVKEVLPWPFDALALQAAVERLQKKTVAASVARAEVLAFTSCKGGSGASFLAANLACMLADGGARVALFDLNLQFGDVHMFVTDDETPHTLSDVMRGMHRLDAGLLKASMLALGPNLSVLAAPCDPSHGLEARPEHVETLLSLARRHFDYIVLDVGRNVDAASVKALDQADRIHAVMQASLPCVRGARQMLDVFRSLEYPARKIELVVNRYERSSDLRIKDIESALGHCAIRTVPNDYAAVAASVNQGMPIAQSAPRSPVTQALEKWSTAVLGRQEQDAPGWAARMVRRFVRSAPGAAGTAVGARCGKLGEPSCH